MPNLKPVLVCWIDAVSANHMDWEEADAEPLAACTVKSIGFLRSRTPAGIELVMSHGGEQICGRWFIPACCIVSVADLTTEPQLAG